MDKYEQEQADRTALGRAEVELKRRESAIVELTVREARLVMQELTRNLDFFMLPDAVQDVYRKLEKQT